MTLSQPSPMSNSSSISSAADRNGKRTLWSKLKRADAVVVDTGDQLDP